MKETLQILKQFILDSTNDTETVWKCYLRLLEDIKWRDEEIAELKDKLHRRNMQIKDLKADAIRYRERLDVDVLLELDNA